MGKKIVEIYDNGGEVAFTGTVTGAKEWLYHEVFENASMAYFYGWNIREK